MICSLERKILVMKETIIIFVVLVLVFVPGFIFANFLESTGSELLDILDDMQNCFDSYNNIDDEKGDKLYDCFLKNESKWIMIVDHEALDEIENGVHECVGFYEEGNEAEFKISSKKLKDHIEDLKKREEICLANIF